MQDRLIASVLGFTIVLSLAACSRQETADPPQIITETRIVKPPRPAVPIPDELNLRSFKFVVITPDNIDDVFSKLKGDKVLFALSTEDYENIALNLSDIRAYIQQQKEIIIVYQNQW